VSGFSLVAGDLLHDVALYEAVVRIEQGATEEANLGGMPARLPHELLDVAFRFLHVVVGGHAHGEEGRGEAFESVVVLPDEVQDVILVFAHVDGGADDHRIVVVRFGVHGALEVHRVGLVAVAPDHLGDVARDPGRQPLAGPYAEAAHIRPLGTPHNGPDTSDNILCLCPNRYVLFDHGGVMIGEDLSLVGAEGRLTVHPRHNINEDYLRYRREHYQVND
jgi:hypothetical protein